MSAVAFRSSPPTWRSVAMAVSVPFLLFLGACSGSSDSDGGATAPVRVECPFTGEATRLTGGSSDVNFTTVTGVAAARAECADTVEVALDGDVPNWTVAYLSGPFFDGTGVEVPLASAVNLAITVSRTTYGPGGTPVTIPVEGLQAARSIQVFDLGGRIVLLVGLDTEKPIQAASSDGNLSVAIG